MSSTIAKDLTGGEFDMGFNTWSEVFQAGKIERV